MARYNDLDHLPFDLLTFVERLRIELIDSSQIAIVIIPLDASRRRVLPRFMALLLLVERLPRIGSLETRSTGDLLGLAGLLLRKDLPLLSQQQCVSGQSLDLR